MSKANYGKVQKIFVQHKPADSKNWISISTAAAGDLFNPRSWMKWFPMRVSVWSEGACGCAQNCEELKKLLALMGHEENLPYGVGKANDTDKPKRPALAASRMNSKDPWAWIRNASR